MENFISAKDGLEWIAGLIAFWYMYRRTNRAVQISVDANRISNELLVIEKSRSEAEIAESAEKRAEKLILIRAISQNISKILEYYQVQLRQMRGSVKFPAHKVTLEIRGELEKELNNIPLFLGNVTADIRREMRDLERKFRFPVPYLASDFRNELELFVRNINSSLAIAESLFTESNHAQKN